MACCNRKMDGLYSSIKSALYPAQPALGRTSLQPGLRLDRPLPQPAKDRRRTSSGSGPHRLSTDCASGRAKKGRARCNAFVHVLLVISTVLRPPTLSFLPSPRSSLIQRGATPPRRRIAPSSHLLGRLALGRLRRLLLLRLGLQRPCEDLLGRVRELHVALDLLRGVERRSRREARDARLGDDKGDKDLRRERFGLVGRAAVRDARSSADTFKSAPEESPREQKREGLTAGRSRGRGCAGRTRGRPCARGSRPPSTGA